MESPTSSTAPSLWLLAPRRDWSERGYDVLNRPLLNQVLFTTPDPDRIAAVVREAQASGEVWFGTTSWNGQPAARISISSWRTTEHEVDRLVELLAVLLPRG